MKKPIDLSLLNIDESDCFGKAWKSTDKACTKCSEYGTCMVITKSKNSSKVKEIRDTTKGFFDELDWKLVPWSDIMEQIIINEGQIKLSDLRNTVKTLSKCVDQATVNYKVSNWLIENSIKVKEGCLYLS